MEDASILVIGEAPGKAEAEQGTVFVGPSGRLLDKVLAHHKLDGNDVRFTNVVACAPPRIQSAGPSAPPKGVVSCCSGRLRAELDNRRHILLLGNTAKEAVLQIRDPITRVRQGPPREVQHLPGTRIIATIHPAACLRTSDNFPSLVRDVGKINGQAYIKWEAPKYAAVDHPEDAVAAIQQLARKAGPITVDIETGVEKDSSFTHPDDLLCVGIGYSRGRAAVIGERALKSEQVQHELGRFLSHKQVICHNGKYDLQVLMRRGIIDVPNLWFDTMLASYTLDERPGHHSLEGCCVEHLGSPAWKNVINKYKGKNDSYAVVPRKILYQYNAYDCANDYDLFEHMRARLERENLRHVHDRLVRYSNELIYIELDGVHVNDAHVDNLTGEYVERLEQLEGQLQRLVRWPTFNPRSPQQVMRCLQAAGLRAPDTAVDTLTALLERQPFGSQKKEFLELMLRHRREQKLYGTYVKGTRKRLIDGRLYPTYLLHGSVSGRLACRNPNLQNVPRESSIRQLIVPTDGNVFVQGDYAQAELRVIAAEAQDRYLKEAFSDPSRDIHAEVGQRVYGSKFDRKNKEQRVRTKAVVFGVAYGREASSIAREYKISLGEAGDIVKAFFSLIPGVVRWRQKIKDQVFHEGQALQTHFGRKRRFWLITRENKMDVEKEALSFPPQSTANDICLSALVALRQAFGDSATAPRLRIPVHDSILVECNRSDREEVAATVRRIMKQAAVDEYTDYVPFEVDIAYGDSWGTLEETNG